MNMDSPEANNPVAAASAPSLDEVVRRLDNLWASDRSVMLGAVDLRGHRFGKYRIDEIIGVGAFGVVYHAVDDQLNREVAVKIPRPEVLVDHEKLERFVKEAKTAAALDHPLIVPVYEAEILSPTPYIVSAFCRGPDLQRWLTRRGRPVPVDQSAEFVAKLALAVQHAHEHGVLHRDLKPSNVLLEPTNEMAVDGLELSHFKPRLTDFGLAKITDDGMLDSRSSLLIGTPLYMAPEQLSGQAHDVTRATDVYALGVLLFELLSLETPFAASNYVELLDQIRSGQARSLGDLNPVVPAELQTICVKCMRPVPANRYYSARDLADDLGRFLQGAPIQARRETIVESVSRWSASPQRIRDAGVATAVVNLALAITMLVTSLGPVLDPDHSMDSMRITDLIRSNAPWAAFGTGVAALGVQVIRRVRWALGLASIATTAQWAYCAAILFFGASPLAEYEGHPMAKWLVHSLLWFLFGGVLGLCLVALRAQARVRS